MDKKVMQELKTLSLPLFEFLKKNCQPYSKIEVSDNGVKVIEDIRQPLTIGIRLNLQSRKNTISAACLFWNIKTMRINRVILNSLFRL